MSWRERYKIKMNRSSWKIAHEDVHPNIQNEEDLQSHLMNHHIGDFIGDEYDHEWFHTDPDGYNEVHYKQGFPVRHPFPDHFHSDNYRKLRLPNTLPEHFAGFNKVADPTDTLTGEGASAFTEPSYQDDQKGSDVVGPQDLDSNATEVDKFPKSVGIFKNSNDVGISKNSNDVGISRNSNWNQRFADSAGGSQFGNPLDESGNRMQSLQDPGMEIRTPLDTGQRNYTEQYRNAEPLTLRSWFTGEDLNGPWPHTKHLTGPLDVEPTDNQNENSTGPMTGNVHIRNAHFDDLNHPFPIEDNIREHLLTHHFGDSPIGDTYLNQVIREQPALSDSQLLGEHLNFHYDDTLENNSLIGKSSWVSPHHHDDNVEVHIPDNLKKISSFKTKNSHFEGITHPWPGSARELADHAYSHHSVGIRRFLRDEGSGLGPERYYRDLIERSDFLKKEILAHKKIHYSVGQPIGNHPHKHDDDLDIGIPENIETIAPMYITSSGKTAHFEGIHHPWPQSPLELSNHVYSHHPEITIHDEPYNKEQYHLALIDDKQYFGREMAAHRYYHTSQSGPKGIHPHHHGENLGEEIPETIDKIVEPKNITSSWHQSFVETINTNPDEESSDTLLNPADELKNARPRANDLPQQSAQLLPGMLIDHDQMGGSGTASGSI